MSDLCKCSFDPCQCRRFEWSRSLLPEVHAWAWLVLSHLPVSRFLDEKALDLRDEKIAYLKQVEPKHLPPGQLLELYLLELLEAVRRTEPRVVVNPEEQNP